MSSRVILHEVATEQFTIGEFTISSAPVVHMDPTVGYRIESRGKAVTYLPDHEPALGANGFPVEAEWTSGYSLAAGADLLIHDAQYTTDEYQERIGWGHSSMPQAFTFARLAEVKHFVPFHHDPTHSDGDLDRLFDEQMRAEPLPFECTPATEGKSFDLD
jgi:ribonuclease BN (tRNA processing enzyme)